MKSNSLLLAGVTLAIVSPPIAQTATPGARAVAERAGSPSQASATSTRHNVADTPAQHRVAMPSGTFIATTLAYRGGGDPRSTSFLRTDDLSYPGASIASDLGNGIVPLQGNSRALNTGAHPLGSNRDDALLLPNGSAPIQSASCCGRTSGSARFATASRDAVDAIGSKTDDGVRTGSVRTDLPHNAVGSMVRSVPAPASWAMMILGMGAIGFALRRQTVMTPMSYAD